ncbi:hypothetical protein GCM10008924_09000 [Gracilibacillus halotolerans]
MKLYIQLYMFFVMIIETMVFVTIVKSILIHNKRNNKKPFNISFLLTSLSGVSLITITLFVALFLI